MRKSIKRNVILSLALSAVGALGFSAVSSIEDLSIGLTANAQEVAEASVARTEDVFFDGAGVYLGNVEAGVDRSGIRFCVVAKASVLADANKTVGAILAFKDQMGNDNELTNDDTYASKINTVLSTAADKWSVATKYTVQDDETDVYKYTYIYIYDFTADAYNRNIVINPYMYDGSTYAYAGTDFRSMAQVALAARADGYDTSKYIRNYAVNYYNGAEKMAYSTTAEYGTAIVAPTVTENGFLGWYADAGLTQEFDFTQTVVGTVNIYAKFKTSATVTYKDGNDVITTVVVDQGETVTAPSIPGYDVVWMNGDTAFDFATEINEDITLTVGSKTLKGFDLKEDSVMFTNGGNVAVEYNNDGEFGIITSTPCNLIGAKLNFDLTAEDIAVFRALGYTHVTYKLNCGVSYPAGSNKFVSILHGTRDIDITLNDWNEIVMTLDEFEAYVTGNKAVFVQNGWVAYSASLRIKDIALAAKATVTYKDGDDVIKTSVVEKGETVSAISMPGYDVVWMNGDTAFDFATEINGDITLTAGSKTLKQIKLTDDSVITTAGGDTALTPDAEGGIGAKVNTSSTGGYSFKLNWKFNLTAEDIEAFKAMGYTHFTFKLYVWSSATNVTTFTILNNTKTVNVVESAYTDVIITLDELSAYVTNGNGNFHSSTWLVYYQGEARIKDMALSATATVTYKDGENVLETSVVKKGETVSAISIPGYDVVWMNGDAEFDFATEINEDITLTATKTIKQIKLTEDSVITTGNGDTALTTDAEGGIGAQVNTSSTGGYSFKLNWKFDLTAEDIEAFKTMGYTHFTFKLYVWSSAKDFTTLTILNKTKTVDVVEGSYVDVTITLDELATYVTSGNGNFHSSTWLFYYQGSASIKDMTVVTL